MELKNLVIDSSKRNTGSVNNFTYQLKWSITKPDTIALESIQLYNTQYTINDTNNKLYWTTRSGVASTSTLTNGNYNAVSLASHIQDVMNAVGADVYTVSFSPTTGKITITNPSGNFSLNFGTNTDKSCAYVIGFNNDNLTGSSSYTSQNIVQLGTKYYVVYSDIVTNNNYDANEIGSVIAFVPNNVVFGDIITYSPNLAKTFKVRSSDISRLSFYVKDDRGNYADLNNIDWSMNLVVATK